MEEHGVVDTNRKVRRVLIYTLVLNEAVAVAKIIWGYMAGSIGMVSDGFHSLFDGVTNVLGLIGIWIASQPPDEEHPYGHKKFETMFTVIVSGMIFLTCFEILRHVYRSLLDGPTRNIGITSFLVMTITIAVNFFVMRYEKRKGVELKSDFLIADSLHTKSNLVSAVGVVIGLLFTRMGYPIADAVAGVLVAVFIAKIGYDILKGATEILVDAVGMDSDAICEVVKSVEGVRNCHNVRSRGSKHHIYLDLHIQLDPDIPLKTAHEITHAVQSKVKNAYPEVADIVVHTEPDRPDNR
jgi:cation diffusion facilitator family transporter